MPFLLSQGPQQKQALFQCPVMFQVSFYWHSKPATSKPTAHRPQKQQPALAQLLQQTSASQGEKSQGVLQTQALNPSLSGPRILLNTANSCYMNSVAQALLDVSNQELNLSHVSQLLQRMSMDSNPRPLNLYSSFALRSLATGWRF